MAHKECNKTAEAKRLVALGAIAMALGCVDVLSGIAVSRNCGPAGWILVGGTPPSDCIGLFNVAQLLMALIMGCLTYWCYRQSISVGQRN